ncbi:MAG: hypothetical protein RL281_839, partial [Pseudomonadota bacterium]
WEGYVIEEIKKMEESKTALEEKIKNLEEKVKHDIA